MTARQSDRRLRKKAIEQERMIAAALPEIIRMRDVAAPWRTIGSSVGHAPETCRRWYMEYMGRQAVELEGQVAAHRADLAARLELVTREMLGTMISSRGTGVAVQAAGRALRAMEQYSRLYGLDAPTRVVIDDVRAMTDPDAIAAELNAMLDAAEARELPPAP